MATTVLGLKTFAAADPVDYNEINDNYNKIDGGVKTALQGRAAHNLLDNSDFANPVNQRGKTSYSNGEYAIDRWKLQPDTNLFIMDGFIRITGSWDAQQILGNKLIGTYTYAICAKVNVAGEYTQTIELYENGSSIKAIFCTVVGEWKIYTCTATFTGTNGTANPMVIINNRAGSVSDASIDVKWASLYEGSYTADTLPAYQPKGYAAELAECQRYYYQSNDNKYGQDGMIIRRAISIEGNTSSFCLESVDLPVTMRITPTITIYDDDGNANAAKEWYTNDKVSNTSIRYANNRSFCVASESGEFVGGKSYFFQYAASADL